ncbi:MAG: ATP-binding region ATPase domain protein [candidate division WS6 bacterium GW2011_GWF2_39_15]|uniref:histidine kinase n=1 Tax=candidate division WS6 bacterium GW2011_GWF2_39_15 TaxID=1619100 RepID=A0A0G0QXX6_9BACT|nr:MAG: ATP-binding region ATPase domain protein [candidate division WS6 bacterium GW2011_GWF2_39_15]
MKVSEQFIYLYLLISAFGWVIANSVADLSKEPGIAIVAARLAILFPLNFMSAFLTIASIFPQTIHKKKAIAANILNIGTVILTVLFALRLNSEQNISSFKIVENGPAEYSPGSFYTISLIYAIVILVTTLAHWIKNLRSYTRTQKLQILALIIALAIVYIFLGVGLTYFPVVGLLEYGPIAFISLGFLLYVTNQTFFVKAFFSDIRETIIRILTVTVIGLIVSIAAYNFILYNSYLNPLSVFLLSIVLFEIITFISNETIKVTQVGHERLRREILDFNSKTATIFKRELVLKELKNTLSSIFPSQEVTLEVSQKGKDPLSELCHKWWEVNGHTKPVTPEIVIDESYKTESDIQWIEKFLKLLIKKQVVLIIPINNDKTVIGLVKLSGANISLDLKEYSLIKLLTQNLSVSMSRAYLYSEVTRFNTRLEQKVKEQTKDINNKYEQLLEAQRRERDMIDIMGHELRTPISIVKLQFELLTKHLINSKIYFSIAEYVENINSAILREVRLINSLLGATKLDQNKLELNFEQANIVSILRESYEPHIHEINKKGLNFTFKSPKGSERWEVEVDRTRILEVFDNIINNAVKYTPKGDIKVELEKDDRYYIVTVSDTGLGISKDSLKHLGEKFYRADHERDNLVVKPGGTGLGVYVSIGIIKKHGGQFKVRSVLGKGSTFVLTIPIHQKNKANTSPQSLNIFERLGLKK